MQHKWTTKLIGYDYEIKYKQGTNNSVADALSRQMEGVIATISSPLSKWLKIVQAETKVDDALQIVIRAIQDQSGLCSHYTYANRVLHYKNRIVRKANSTWCE